MSNCYYYVSMDYVVSIFNQRIPTKMILFRKSHRLVQRFFSEALGNSFQIFSIFLLFRKMAFGTSGASFPELNGPVTLTSL